MPWLETAVFALLIGGQFLAAVVLVTKRHSLYGETKQEAVRDEFAFPPNLDQQTR